MFQESIRSVANDSSASSLRANAHCYYPSLERFRIKENQTRDPESGPPMVKTLKCQGRIRRLRAQIAAPEVESVYK